MKKKIAEETVLTKKVKVKIKRKKVAEPVVTAVLPPTPIVTREPEGNRVQPDKLAFYGHEIRCTYMSNQWYFSLEDILKVAKVIDPVKFLIELKNREGLKDDYYKLVETFSYYEGESPMVIPVVNFQSFWQLLPFFRLMGISLPGPLPEWLKNMANRKF